MFMLSLYSVGCIFIDTLKADLNDIQRTCIYPLLPFMKPNLHAVEPYKRNHEATELYATQLLCAT